MISMGTVTKTEWHPAACIFPMLPDAELKTLADDIREYGLREPIVLFQLADKVRSDSIDI